MCSFSYARAISLVLLFQVFTYSACAQTGEPQQASSEPAATNQEVLPKPANTMPPALPDRTVPAPPAISHTPASSQVKQPLAWRQKALNISCDKFKQNAAAANSNQRVIIGSYSDVIVALTETCSGFSYKSEQFNSNAGELLVSNGKSRFLFCLWEQEPSKTTIAACVEKGKNSETLKTLNAILDSTCTAFAHRGRI